MTTGLLPLPPPLSPHKLPQQLRRPPPQPPQPSRAPCTSAVCPSPSASVGPGGSCCRRLTGRARPPLLLLLLLLLSAAGLLSRPCEAYPPSLEGPAIPDAVLHRVFPTATPVEFDMGDQGNAGPYLTLVGSYFTNEYGVGSLRCRFRLFEGDVTVCAERTTGGCVSTATDQTR